LKRAQEQDLSKPECSEELFELRDGVLMRKFDNKSWVPYIPPALRSEVLYAAHDLRGHFSWKKSILYLRSISWWDTQRNDLKEYIKSCHVCQLKKTVLDPQRHEQFQHLDAKYPFELVSVDFTGPFPMSSKGNRYLLVMIDHFSRFVRLVPCKDQTAIAAADSLFQYITDFAIPSRILSDRGSAFISKLFNLLCARVGIKRSMSTAYHPSGNGMVERINRLVNSAYVPSFSDWEHQMKLLQIALNSTQHSTTGKSPHEMLFGNQPLQPFHSIVSYDRDAKRFSDMKHVIRKIDTSRIPIFFNIGDLVLVRSYALSGNLKKTSSPWIGPYKVLDVKDKLYLLRPIADAMSTGDWFNVQRLKRYYIRDSSFSTTSTSNSISNSTSITTPNLHQMLRI